MEMGSRATSFESLPPPGGTSEEAERPQAGGKRSHHFDQSPSHQQFQHPPPFKVVDQYRSVNPPPALLAAPFHHHSPLPSVCFQINDLQDRMDQIVSLRKMMEARAALCKSSNATATAAAAKTTTKTTTTTTILLSSQTQESHARSLAEHLEISEDEFFSTVGRVQTAVNECVEMGLSLPKELVSEEVRSLIDGLRTINKLESEAQKCFKVKSSANGAYPLSVQERNTLRHALQMSMAVLGTLETKTARLKSQLRQKIDVVRDYYKATGMTRPNTPPPDDSWSEYGDDDGGHGDGMDFFHGPPYMSTSEPPSVFPYDSATSVIMDAFGRPSTRSHDTVVLPKLPMRVTGSQAADISQNSSNSGWRTEKHPNASPSPSSMSLQSKRIPAGLSLAAQRSASMESALTAATSISPQQNLTRHGSHRDTPAFELERGTHGGQFSANAGPHPGQQRVSRRSPESDAGSMMGDDISWARSDSIPPTTATSIGHFRQQDMYSSPRRLLHDDDEDDYDNSEPLSARTAMTESQFDPISFNSNQDEIDYDEDDVTWRSTKIMTFPSRSASRSTSNAQSLVATSLAFNKRIRELIGNASPCPETRGATNDLTASFDFDDEDSGTFLKGRPRRHSDELDTVSEESDTRRCIAASAFSETESPTAPRSGFLSPGEDLKLFKGPPNQSKPGLSASPRKFDSPKVTNRRMEVRFQDDTSEMTRLEKSSVMSCSSAAGTSSFLSERTRRDSGVATRMPSTDPDYIPVNPTNNDDFVNAAGDENRHQLSDYVETRLTREDAKMIKRLLSTHVSPCDSQDGSSSAGTLMESTASQLTMDDVTNGEASRHSYCEDAAMRDVRRSKEPRQRDRRSASVLVPGPDVIVEDRGVNADLLDERDALEGECEMKVKRTLSAFIMSHVTECQSTLQNHPNVTLKELMAACRNQAHVTDVPDPPWYRMVYDSISNRVKFVGYFLLGYYLTMCIAEYGVSIERNVVPS